MRIVVASLNPVKIQAVREITHEYPMLAGAEILSLSVPSGVNEQPKTLADTVLGARNRAHAAFPGHDLSIGIESGLMGIPYTQNGIMNLCACMIYDGKRYYAGISSLFEYPPIVMHYVRLGVSVSDACKKAGLTEHVKVGEAEGAIGILTHGRVNRTGYTKQAIRMALVQLENKNLYQAT